MTKDRSLADTQPMRVKRPWNWLIYVVGALVLAALIARATLNEAARNPAREATTSLDPYGLLTLRFSTDPNPPLPTGTVKLSFRPMDSQQRPVTLDAVSFEYGREDSAQPVGAGQAQLVPDGSGVFIGGAQFSQVGNWWVRVKMSKGGAHGEVRFTFYVEPAQ
ncbi:MAG: hypothetical protein ACRDH2_02845 [Anaerolineales bacterium]